MSGTGGGCSNAESVLKRTASVNQNASLSMATRSPHTESIRIELLML
jgi:hypothetical protein